MGATPAAQYGTVTLTIDGKTVTLPRRMPMTTNPAEAPIGGATAPATIFDAAKQAGIRIPALCHREDLRAVGVCRMCLVQVEGEPIPAASCMREASEGMVVRTTTPEIEESRKTLTEMLLAEHPTPCARERGQAGSCELEDIGRRYGILEPRFTGRIYDKGDDRSNLSIAIDHAACILCDRCVRACGEVAGEHVITRSGKGAAASIAFDNDEPMGGSSCVNCGWCMVSCPTGAITYTGVATAGGDGNSRLGVTIEPEDLKRNKSDWFGGVAIEFLRRSRGGVRERRYAPGEVICRQNDYGHTAYLIQEGEVDIYLELAPAHVRTQAEGGFFGKVKSLLLPRASDKRRAQDMRSFIPIDADVDLAYVKPIARIGEGELVGEAACLNGQRRSATMRAVGNVIVWEMDRNVLDILRRQKSFRLMMEDKYRNRALENHLRSNPIFRDLPAEFIEELRDRVELVSFAPGEVIFRQGDRADAFYLVRMGHVKVYEEFRDQSGMVMRYLSRSQGFGEIGLLYDRPRTASCSALDHVELLRIVKPDFDLIMASFPAVADRIRAAAEERLAADRQRGQRHGQISLPQFINQGLYQAQSLLILDLEKCTRCDECVKACAEAHDGVTRLLREGVRFDKYLVTTSCRSCRDPYCLIGCPVDAIHRKGDLQIIIEDHCVGCGRCAENCPYGNINMHEFDVVLEDLATKERVSQRQLKATVCDLCDDQCLGENEVPSCVYACPHDAAHRVDGESFFNELVPTAGTRGERTSAAGAKA